MSRRGGIAALITVVVTAGVTACDSDPSGLDGTGGSDVTNVVEDVAGDVTQALEDGDFTTFLEALNLTSIADELEGRQVTILAPTNEAFTGLSADQLQTLLADPARVDDVLRGHIIDEKLTFEELTERSSVTALSGDVLDVAWDGTTLTVNGATATPSDAAVSADTDQQIAVFALGDVLLLDR